MMKKLFLTICIALLLIPAIGAAVPQVAHAQAVLPVISAASAALSSSPAGALAVGTALSLTGAFNEKGVPGTLGIWFIEIVEYMFYLFQVVASWFLVLMSGLLNATMLLTLNIKTIVDHAAVIGTAWVTIRNFASICIIFMLLYASILMILGMKGNLGELIKNVVIAGLLINFSLFFTKVLIDGSNVISLSFYSAIAPKFTTSISSDSYISNAFNKPGIADIFMQNLKIQTVPAPVPIANTNTLQIDIGIIITEGMTAFLTFAAGISFLAAAIAFALRAGMLLLLMAFSPIYFIGMMFPEVQTYAKQWKDSLFGMCVFMPVYLFLMYVAMMVLQDPSFSSFIHGGSSATDTGGNGVIGPGTIGLVVNYVIAMFFINFPLLAAIKLGGNVVQIGNNAAKAVKKWGQGALKTTGKAAWRNTGGRLANNLAEQDGFKNFAANNVLGEAALRVTRGVAGNYNKKLTEKTEKRVKFAESLGHDREATRLGDEGIRSLNVQIAEERAKKITDPVLKAASEAKIKALRGDIAYTREQIVQIESARKQAYANRHGQKSGFWGLYHKVAHSNPVAADKLYIDVLEKQIAGQKKDLDDAKQDLKDIERAITNSQAITNNQPGTQKQQDKRQELLDKQSQLSRGIQANENLIGELKLTK